MGRCLLLALLIGAIAGCRDPQESPAVSGRGIKATGEREVPEAQRSARTTACRPARVDVSCLSGEAVGWLPEDLVGKAASGAAERRFPKVQASSLILAIEYVLRFSQGGETQTAFLGVGARLHGAGAQGPIDLAEEATADLPWPAGCPADPTAPQAGSCRPRLSDALAQALDQVMLRLALRCELLSCTPVATERLLASEVAWERLEAVRSVGECRFEKLAPGLLPLLDAADPQLALAALVALGQTGWPDGVAAIVRRSQAADERMQRAAAQALADIGTAEALRYLNDWARLHPDPMIRELCEELVRSGSGAESPGRQ